MRRHVRGRNDAGAMSIPPAGADAGSPSTRHQRNHEPDDAGREKVECEIRAVDQTAAILGRSATGFA